MRVKKNCAQRKRLLRLLGEPAYLISSRYAFKLSRLDQTDNSRRMRYKVAWWTLLTLDACLQM